MDTENYDEKIAKLMVDVDLTREKMSEILDNFLSATEITVYDYYKKTVKNQVTSKPDITKNHGKKVLGELKSDCRKILDNIPEIVKEKIDIEKLWSHKWPMEKLETKNKEYYRESHYDFRQPKIDANLRDTLDNLIDLLLKYDYLENKDSRYNYFLHVDCTEDMKRYFKEYKKMDSELARLVSKIIDLKNAKAKTEAENLWDES
ncbi:hypothetical protein SDC9_40591 [bioreactor metagenome]|uniref:Uncharacterized protein n=1 Tax=bioreactor metagenome TaxID=1076179 RepID=A0A644VSV0_9ZZZZ|nr:hypothetical protein [Methanobrevibacter sp.]MEA4957124.1 hypothetical protein [Methanobrevibacter sp.]